MYKLCWPFTLSTVLLLMLASPGNANQVIAAAEAAETKAPIYNTRQVVTHPQAKSVELDEPVIEQDSSMQDNIIVPVVDAVISTLIEEPFVAADSVEPVASPSPSKQQPLIILNTEVLPATSTRLPWSPSESFEDISSPTPILIVNGAQPGPILCLTAAVHGDELNGIEIVRRILYNLDPNELTGTVIGVPIVNLQGFRRGSRYLTDRRDLNRYFPGNPNGSSAARIAYSFFTEVISHCDALVDIHTGSFHRTNLPQLRGETSNPKVLEVIKGFGATVVLQSGGAIGTLRRAALEAGIPTVTLETGESMRLQESAVEHGVKGIHTLLNQMGMTKHFRLLGDPEPVYFKSVWVRVNHGGILFANVGLGDRVKAGSLLGEVTDPITNVKAQIISPKDGRIIGMAVNQVVLPGFAAFHVAIRAPEQLSDQTEKIKSPKKQVTGVNPPLVTPLPATTPLTTASIVAEPGEEMGEDDIDEEEVSDGQPHADADDND